MQAMILLCPSLHISYIFNNFTSCLLMNYRTICSRALGHLENLWVTFGNQATAFQKHCPHWYLSDKTRKVSLTIYKIKIGSGNGLLPEGTKSLFEPMLTYLQRCSVALSPDCNFNELNPLHFFKDFSFKISTVIVPHLPRANELP